MSLEIEGSGHSMLDLALSYIGAGYPVFPVRERDDEVFIPSTGEFVTKSAKSPYTANGLKAATRNERIVRRWWSDHPNAMVGLPTGSAAGFWVLDLDRRPDIDGAAELERMEAEHGSLPQTVTVRTPSGGRHLLFALPEGVEVRNRGALAPGQDVRGESGYIVAAGSVMADGRNYEWETRADEPAMAPQWLLDLVVRKQHEPVVGLAPRGEISTAYVDAAVRDELDSLAATPMGNRNNVLNDGSFALGTFVGAGVLAESDARAMLEHVAKGWGRDLARCLKTIDNGLKAGMRNPRKIPESDRDDGALIEAGARLAARLLSDRTAEPDEPPASDEEDRPVVVATPLKWKDPSTLPRRDFLYGPHFIRKYVSVTVAPGGLGKSSLLISEALAMRTGRALLGTKPTTSLRVWILNLEDDRDELERRVFAACIHHKVAPDELDGFFLDSGREQEVVVAVEHKRDGFKIIRPVVDAMIETIKRNRIDVVIVDPFVSSHGVPENDNGAIDKVAKLWAKIADECNCAIEIVHHVRKVADREVAVEDARGAVSLLAAARSARVLNRMTEEQAQAAGVGPDERFTIFGVQRGKSNLAPMSAQGEWRKLQSVALGNGRGPMKPQDHAPVVTEWEWPSAEKIAASVTDGDMALIRARVQNSDCRESPQAKDWVGHKIGEVLELDSTDSEDKKRIGSIVKAWLSNGTFVLEMGKDEKGQSRKYVRMGGE